MNNSSDQIEQEANNTIHAPSGQIKAFCACNAHGGYAQSSQPSHPRY